jgi:hypothetical protein
MNSPPARFMSLEDRRPIHFAVKKDQGGGMAALDPRYAPDWFVNRCAVQQVQVVALLLISAGRGLENRPFGMLGHHCNDCLVRQTTQL